MIPRNILVAAAIAGVGGGAYSVWKKYQTPLETKPVTLRRLPGFTIYLPDHSKDRVASLDYGAGKLEVVSLGGTNASLHLGWQSGEIPDAAGILEIGRVTAKSLGASTSAVHTVGNTEGRTIALDDDGKLFMSFTQCGTRAIMAVSESAGFAAHQRIVDTISCQPDPDKENAPTTIPLAIDLPGFVQAEHFPGQVTLDKDGARVLLRRQQRNEHVEVITDKLASDFLKVLGVDGILGPRHGDVLTFTARFVEDAQPGLFRFVTCADSTTLVVAFAVDMATMNELEPRIAAARCLLPGETAPTWPDVEPGVDPDDLEEPAVDEPAVDEPAAAKP